MFGGAPPSKAEIKKMEDRANDDIKFALVSCVALYLAPFVVDFASNIF